MTKKEYRHHLHMMLLAKSFHRKGDDLTSVLLGDAVSTATDLFCEILESRVKNLKDAINEADGDNCRLQDYNLIMKLIKENLEFKND